MKVQITILKVALLGLLSMSSLQALGDNSNQLPSTLRSVYLDGKWDRDINCWIEKIDLTSPLFQEENDGQIKLAENFKENDNGKFTVLRHVQSRLLGGSLPPQFVDPDQVSVSLQQALQILKNDKDCTGDYKN